MIRCCFELCCSQLEPATSRRFDLKAIVVVGYCLCDARPQVSNKQCVLGCEAPVFLSSFRRGSVRFALWVLPFLRRMYTCGVCFHYERKLFVPFSALGFHFRVMSVTSDACPRFRPACQSVCECILVNAQVRSSGNYSFPSPPWDSISEVCPSQVTLVHGFALHANQCASAFW